MIKKNLNWHDIAILQMPNKIIKKIKFIKKPFEYILVENLLSNSFLKKLNSELIIMEKKLATKVMSGR